MFTLLFLVTLAVMVGGFGHIGGSSFYGLGHYFGYGVGAVSATALILMMLGRP